MENSSFEIKSTQAIEGSGALCLCEEEKLMVTVVGFSGICRKVEF